ncbi:hypothetical protein [Spirosoma lituiforme]
MKIKHLFLSLFATLWFCTVQAQVKVGDNPGTIQPSAVLELETTNKGFLPPRIALTATNVAAPVTSPSTSLLVYNTATSGTTPYEVAPGYYYWNGTQWKAFVSTTVLQGAESKAGQYMRIGLNNNTYTAGLQAPLRFSNNNSAAEMVLAPNGAENFVNTIEGASFSEGVSLSAGQGTPVRTTDQIVLPAGLFRITLRLTGYFAAASDNNVASVKIAVNNNEYSFAEGVVSGTTSISTTGTIVDYLNLQTTQTVDLLLIVGGNNFTPVTRMSPGTGQAYRSLIMIERLK